MRKESKNVRLTVEKVMTIKLAFCFSRFLLFLMPILFQTSSSIIRIQIMLRDRLSTNSSKDRKSRPDSTTRGARPKICYGIRIILIC